LIRAKVFRQRKPENELMYMGNIKVILPDDLEQKFREEVFKSKGMKKGNITLAIEEAVRLWIESEKGKRSGAAKKAWDTRKARS